MERLAEENMKSKKIEELPKPSKSPEKLLSKPKIINPKSEREMLREISDEIPDALDPREKVEDRFWRSKKCINGHFF